MLSRWAIVRHIIAGPGDHTIGPETVRFNDAGLGETGNQEVADHARLFPAAFTVMEQIADAAGEAAGMVDDVEKINTEEHALAEIATEHVSSALDLARQARSAASEVIGMIDDARGANASVIPSREQIESMGIFELRNVARQLEMRGFFQFSKAELLSAILLRVGE